MINAAGGCIDNFLFFETVKRSCNVANVCERVCVSVCLIATQYSAKVSP